jgi:hypothetical protein
MYRRIIAAALFTAALAVAASAQVARTPAPPGAKVYFIAPADGAVLSTPVTIRFGLAGMGVAPAGSETPNTGHHHLIIDGRIEDYGAAIPKDAHHIHFGGGQTEARLDLPPGRHTLQLVLGDRNHLPFDPPLQSEVITVTVR